MTGKTFTVTEHHKGNGTSTVKTIEAPDRLTAAKRHRRFDPILNYSFTDNLDGTVSITVSTSAGARYPDHFTYMVHVAEGVA
jgi:hypothetical protein